MPPTRLCRLLQLLVLSAMPLGAQKPVRLSSWQAELEAHRLTPYPRIHTDRLDTSGAQGPFSSVHLELTIASDGRVAKALATDGSPALRKQAEALARMQTFTPFKVHGRIVPIVVDDLVPLLPPEQWLPIHRPLPASVDLHTLSFSLQRTVCLGTCPAYTVTVHGDGAVDFVSSYFVAAAGRHTAHVSPDTVQALLSAFRHADYLSARPEYRYLATDNPTQLLTLSFNGHTSRVLDYIGPQAGMPDAVHDLEEAVDRAADSARWVTGDSATLPSLQAEHYDFSSKSLENRQLYVAAASQNLSALLDALLAAHAPWDLPTQERGSELSSRLTVAPICAATEQGNLDAVRRMLELKLPMTTTILRQCAASAAHSGRPALVALWACHGDRPLVRKRPAAR